MVSTQSLDLESGEADQLDLFYLVDCVLDEIEQAKALKQSCEPDGEHTTIMPAAEAHEQVDLLEHIESALSPTDESITMYNLLKESYIQPQTFTRTDTQHNTQNFLDDLVEQIDMDNEYLAFVSKDNNKDIPNTPTTTSYSSISSPLYNVPTRENIVPQDILQSAMSLQYAVKENNTIKVDDSVSTMPNNESEKSQQTDKEYLKHFDELQKYSDLIQLPDMTSHFTSESQSAVKDSMHYQQSQQMNTVQNHHFFDEDSNETTASDLMSWTLKHPENWNPTEVLDWLYYSAEKHGADCSLLRGESFRTITGQMLCKMNADDFRALDPFFGDFLYKLFRQLINGLHFTMPAEPSFSEHSDLDQTYSYTESHCSSFSMATSPSSHTNSHMTSPGQSSTQTSPDMYPQGTEKLGHYDFVYATPCGSQASQSTETGSMLPPQGSLNYAVGLQSMNYSYDFSGSHFSTNTKSQYKMSARERYDTNGTPRRRPGRPRIKSIPTEEELQAQREKKMKSQHLWEFIFDMLNNPAYNPSVLKWENQNEGVFRFVQSESVAQLWGTLKSNENMTYEKLSRAMRHYYKRGILERVEGRRLVYKFSMGTLERMRQKKTNAAGLRT